MTRKTFQRLSEDVRRRALIEATLNVIADHGLHAASARKIAAEAGVSAGLIRHYFASKDEMVRESYAYLIGMLTGQAAQDADAPDRSAESRLASFIARNLSEPNLSSFKVSLWATFIGVVRSDPEFDRIHKDSYGEFLEILEGLIPEVLASHGRTVTGEETKRLSIVVNGVIDGLWLEGSLEHGIYDPAGLAEIGVAACEDLLHLPKGTLTRHLGVDTGG